jgi:glycosyltransferase involved in cell wall biosynthesis
MSTPLRILFVAPYAPSRIRVRPFQLLRALAGRGHRITLVCAAGSADSPALDELRAVSVMVRPVAIGRGERVAAYLRALGSDLPLQAAHCLAPALVKGVRGELRRGSYDMVHIEHLRGAEVARAAVANLADTPPLLLDAVDSISLLFERTVRHSPSARARALALADLARTRRYEAAYGWRFDHITLTSPEDRWAIDTLRERYGEPQGAPISVVPNGVDLDYFRPGDVPRDRETVIFSGKMSYHANEAAALFLLRSVMPLVWRVRPTARVVIAGAQPSPALLAHAREPLVTVTGYVPDLRPHLAGATVTVAPIRYGVGVQNKVLEALAMGLPVVAARQATVALAARPGHELLVADEAAEFATAILQLLADPARCGALGRAGRGYVERNHSWEASAAILESCYGLARARRAESAKRIVSGDLPGFTGVLAPPTILQR